MIELLLVRDEVGVLLREALGGVADVKSHASFGLLVQAPAPSWKRVTLSFRAGGVLVVAVSGDRQDQWFELGDPLFFERVVREVCWLFGVACETSVSILR